MKGCLGLLGMPGSVLCTDASATDIRGVLGLADPLATPARTTVQAMAMKRQNKRMKQSCEGDGGPELWAMKDAKFFMLS